MNYKVDDCRQRVFCGTNNHGFSLLEVMIALVILMVGMLGLAGLHTVSMSNLNSAYLRSQAVIQAHDMADRMYANIEGVDEGAYDSISGLPSNPPTCLTTATSEDALSGINCSSAQIAQFDASEWNTINATVLPNGTGTVVAAGDGIYTITLAWEELQKSDSGQDTKTFVYKVRPLPIAP